MINYKSTQKYTKIISDGI